MWTRSGTTWRNLALPFVIERRVEFADLMPGEVLAAFEVRRRRELLAVRFNLTAATPYAEEPWEDLDERH